MAHRQSGYPVVPLAAPSRASSLVCWAKAPSPPLVGPLAGKTLADLVTAIRENRAYVNVHTQQFPGGEIRGGLK
jgi:hypothetical protein